MKKKARAWNLFWRNFSVPFPWKITLAPFSFFSSSVFSFFLKLRVISTFSIFFSETTDDFLDEKTLKLLLSSSASCSSIRVLLFIFIREISSGASFLFIFTQWLKIGFHCVFMLLSVCIIVGFTDFNDFTDSSAGVIVSLLIFLSFGKLQVSFFLYLHLAFLFELVVYFYFHILYWLMYVWMCLNAGSLGDWLRSCSFSRDLFRLCKFFMKSLWCVPKFDFQVVFFGKILWFNWLLHILPCFLIWHLSEQFNVCLHTVYIYVFMLV